MTRLNWWMHTTCRPPSPTSSRGGGSVFGRSGGARPRRLHDRLYDLRYRLDSDASRLELVWGHLLVNVAVGGRQVSYPLLATPVVVEYDAEATEVQVVADGAPRLQVEALLGWDSHRIADLQELGGDRGQVTLDVWDPEMRSVFAARAMRRLGLDPIIRTV